jgi:DNA-binding HxlR family transcriptional regulator
MFATVDLASVPCTSRLSTGDVEAELTRTGFPTIPPRVEYELTKLGRSLLVPVSELGLWARKNRSAIQNARRLYDSDSPNQR